MCVGLSQRVGVGVLLEEPADEVFAHFVGPLLALVEGDELVLIGGVEKEVVSGRSVDEELLSSGIGQTGGLFRGVAHR